MKIRKLLYIVFASFFVTVPGCDILDLNKQPQNQISDAAVYTDKNLTEANLAQIYEWTHFLYRDVNNPVWDIFLAGMGAEARGFAFWQANAAFPLEIIDADGAGPIDYWPYSNIRNANEFIEGVRNSDYEQDYIIQRVAEARYLRAHEYFEMVKRYGGVPIITEPQTLNSPLEELRVERNSEQEVYDFIASEMDAIQNDLPEVGEVGRVDKYTALSLKSRAMLYAASVAEFDDVKLSGLLGIPSAEAQDYWQASYDASQEIINSGRFDLYNGVPDDPVQNFMNLFTDEGNNPERIFVKQYDADQQKGHSWDLGNVPMEMRQTWGSNTCPFLNIIEEFEYADGTPGDIDRNLIESGYLFDVNEVFGNRDPRFLATFHYPESVWQGQPVHFHRRTAVDGEVLTSGTIGEDDWPAQGPRRNWVNTGFLVKKMMDEELVGPVREASSQDWLVYRYAEILLNSAEAAYHLGQQGEALQKVNLIRERAGMPELISISLEDIRHERQVEFAFENHRYWDLRRWRIAHEFLDGLRTEGLEYTYHYDEGRYEFHLKAGDPSERHFQERHYYLPLGVNRLANNPNLVENPGY